MDYTIFGYTIEILAYSPVEINHFGAGVYHQEFVPIEYFRDGVRAGRWIFGEAMAIAS